MVLVVPMWKPFCFKLLLVLILMVFARLGLAKDQGTFFFFFLLLF